MGYVAFDTFVLRAFTVREPSFLKEAAKAVLCAISVNCTKTIL